MKKLVIALIFGIALSGNAQDLNNWQVGLNLNPFIYSRINSDYKPEKAKQNFPNGFGYGLTIEKNWNEHWGIKTGFEYSKQNQKYDNYWFTGNVYKSTVSADFKYYKFPITVQYFYPIRENLYLTFNQGIQIAQLNDYKTVIDDELQILTITPDIYHFYYKQSNTENLDKTDRNLIYKKQTYGIIGSIGLKGFLTKKISYSTNLRYEYDLSSADTEKAFFSDNHNTKNFRLSLELGLQYQFSLAGCSFCKNQPH